MNRIWVMLVVLLLVPMLVASSMLVAGAATVSVSVINTTSVPDGGIAVLYMVTNITGITEVPAADIGWSLELDPQIFNVSGVSALVTYVDDAGNVYTETPVVSITNNIVDILFELISTASTSLLINLTVEVPILPGVVNEAGVPVTYVSSARSGTTTDPELKIGNITVYIIPTPPSIGISVDYSLVSPGVPVEVNVTASDGSGVQQVTMRVLLNNSIVYERLWTIGAVLFEKSTTITFNETGVYTIQVEACDTIGNCGVETATINVTDVFTVPGNFNTISEALLSPTISDNVTILVVGSIREASSVNITKRVVIMGATADATVEFANTTIGFNILVPGVELRDLIVRGASTAFMLCSNSTVISNVNVYGERFLDICSTAYIANTIINSHLNDQPVLYLYEAIEAIVNASYAEAHLYSGSYELYNTSIGLLQTAYSTVTGWYTETTELIDLTSSTIILHESPAPSIYRGTQSSRIELYEHLKVIVQYNETAWPGVTVAISSVALPQPLVELTDENGSAVFTILVGYGTTNITVYSTRVNITATYMGLTTTIENLDLATLAEIVVELPVPELNATLTDMLGNPITEISRGQLVKLNATYNLKGFTGSANLTVTLLQDGEPIAQVTLPLGANNASIEVIIFIPWEEAAYSIEVSLELETLPTITIELP